MFKYLRLKKTQEPAVLPERGLTAAQLLRDPELPISLQVINRLEDNVKQRAYRNLLPISLLHRFEIDPINWKGPDKLEHIQLFAPPEKGVMRIEARHKVGCRDPFLILELEDNAYNGINLNFLIVADPFAPRFDIDVDPDGRDTLYGTIHRHIPAEAEALAAGLAPAQTRAGLKASRQILEQLELFLMALGHRAYYLEPLTYVSAWVFERYGFAYVSGHKLMDEIEVEFQMDGRLRRALTGQTPFRHPDHWQTVRGRAWAIHDGVLEAIDQRWDRLRMVKRLGRHAGVNTFPNAAY